MMLKPANGVSCYCYFSTKALTIALLFIVLQCTVLKAQVINGKIDLKEVDFSKGAIELNGNWNFYWKAFRSPLLTPLPSDSVITVPASWSHKNRYSPTGYATYCIVLTLGQSTQPLAISFPNINSSFKIWINGKLQGEAGNISTTEKNYRASLQNSIFHLPDTSHIRLTIQVSNFTYFSGGITKAPLIGHSMELFNKQNQSKGIVNFFAGCLFSIFAYQLILFVLYPKGKPYLWLSLICLIISLRSMIVHTGSFLLPELFAEVPVEIWKKIEFGGVYCLGLLVALYVYNLYKAVASRLPVLILLICSLVLLLIVMVTPQYVYGKLLDIAHAVILSGIVYSFYTVLKARRAGSKEATIIFYGLFAATPFFLMEIIFNNTIKRVENTSSLILQHPVEVGLLVFLTFQVYLLAKYYAMSVKRLSSINNELENAVNERSKELIETSLIKDKLLSIIAHDVITPINSLKGIIMLFNKQALEIKEFRSLVKTVEEQLNSASTLIESILSWSKIQIGGYTGKNDCFNLKELIEDNIQLLDSVSSKKAIHFQYSIGSVIVCWDKPILNMVLRNLLANAIKFSHYGGQVNIYIKNQGSDITIGVRDYGVGMDDEFMDIIIQSQKVVSKPGTTGEQGNGIGLSLCKEYLTKVGGKLICSSKLNEGTEFLICFTSHNVKA